MNDTIKLLLLFATLLGYLPLSAQTEAQAAEDIVILQKIKNGRERYLRKGDKVLFPQHPEPPYRETKGTLIDLDSTQLTLVTTKKDTTVLNLAEAPYFRPLRPAQRTFGGLLLGFAIAGRLIFIIVLSIIYALVGVYTGTLLAPALVLFFWFLFEPISTFLGTLGILLLRSGAPKITRQKFRIRPGRLIFQKSDT